MSTETTITLLTSIGSFVSAIVALITVVEIRKQRKTTYRPELFVNDTHFEIDKNPLFSDSKFLTFKDSHLQVRFDVENLGFGVARIIQFEWIFDLHNAFNILTEYLPKDYTYNTHYEYCSFSKNEFFESFDLGDLTPDIIDFLSPKVHNAKKTTIPIPDAIIKIFIYNLIFKYNMLSDNLNDLMYEEFEEMPTIILNIKYQDLNGDKYIRTYNVKVSAILNFTENPQNRKSPIFYYKFTEKYIT